MGIIKFCFTPIHARIDCRIHYTYCGDSIGAALYVQSLPVISLTKETLSWFNPLVHRRRTRPWESIRHSYRNSRFKFLIYGINLRSSLLVDCFSFSWSLGSVGWISDAKNFLEHDIDHGGTWCVSISWRMTGIPADARYFQWWGTAGLMQIKPFSETLVSVFRWDGSERTFLRSAKFA